MLKLLWKHTRVHVAKIQVRSIQNPLGVGLGRNRVLIFITYELIEEIVKNILKKLK